MTVAFAAMTVVTALAMSEPSASATGAPKPTVTFTATLQVVPNSGGSVNLAANVTNASSCIFSANPSIAGLPYTVPCSAGSATDAVTLPANHGKKALKYTFKFSAVGATTKKAKSVKITVGRSLLTNVVSVAGAAPGVPNGGHQGRIPEPLVGLATAGRNAGAAGTPGSFCALIGSGSIECWGDNSAAELGTGTTGGPDCSGACSETPLTVPGISDATSIFADGDGYCASLASGDFDCWGSVPMCAELSWGCNMGPTTIPDVTGVTDIATSDTTTCALESSGTIECWGSNDYGQLGDGADPSHLVPSPGPVAVVGISDAIGLAGNWDPAFCALHADGQVSCWGYGELLGAGFTSGPQSCGGNWDCSTSPVPVVGITNATSIYSGLPSFCAIVSSGGIMCWGANNGGQLGAGIPDVGTAYRPVAVVGISNAVSITGDNWNSYCALLADGTIRCWGETTFGQLGDGTPLGLRNGEQVIGPDCGGICSDTPVQVSGITGAVGLIGSGGFTYCAILSTGGIDCWGQSGNGILGNGTSGRDFGSNSPIPVGVTGITTAIGIATDGFGFCGLLSGGAISCWGFGNAGQLGNGVAPDPNTGMSDTPVAVVSPN